MCPARFWQPTCWCEVWKLRCEDRFLLAGQLQRFVVQRQLARGETKNAPKCKLLLRLKPSHVLVSLPLLEQLSYYICHGKSAQGQGCNMAARDYLLKVYGPPHLKAGSLPRRVSSEHLMFLLWPKAPVPKSMWERGHSLGMSRDSGPAVSTGPADNTAPREPRVF